MNDSTSVRLLHFADAHIDIANYGRHDPATALPVRVMDFLRALDQIVETAVTEQVDLVIFAGDAYKDRNPQPTFQRAWGERMMRLSEAGIPTLLLVGNHDVSPASGRAHTLHEFNTLNVSNIHVADRIRLWRPDELGVPVQIISVPWVSRSQLLTREELVGRTRSKVVEAIEDRVMAGVRQLIKQADPTLPLILTAHASVTGASYGSERAVMLGDELVLGGSIVHDRRLDYVALGHIHKHQALTKRGEQPPVVYPGSIERIDFGEVRETKGFVLAEVRKGDTAWEFVPLKTRPFHDIKLDTPDAATFMEDIMHQLPAPERLQDAICRLQLTYPQDWEPLLDEKRIYDHFEGALSLQLQKHRLSEKRARLGDTVALDSLSRLDLLEIYWRSVGLDENELTALQELASEVLADVDTLER